jgi:hypothetical protein
MNSGLPAERKTFKFIPERLAEELESRGVSPNKAFEYLVLFVALTAIYYFYFMRDWKPYICNPETLHPFDLPLLMLKFLIFTAWPFALVAAFDSNWSSKDAGNIFLAAYAAGCLLFLHKTGCGFCAFGMAVRAIPYVFCAWVAHGLGALRHRFRAGN